MNTVILIAMQADEARIRKVVEALLEAKLDFWWERPEAGEGGWERSIKTVMEARSVVFFWSDASLGEHGGDYRALAERALAADKAISVRLERVPVPEAFRKTTVINLFAPHPTAKNVFLLDLAAAAKAKSSGLDPPPLRGPARQMFRRGVIAFPTILFVIGLISTFKSFPGLIGLDKIVTQDERRDWAAIHPNSCPDLRAFLSKHLHGIHAEDAKTLLNTRRESTETSWRPVDKPLPLYVSRGSIEAKESEQGARTLAQQRASQQSATDCQAYAMAGSFRVVSATPVVDEWLCGPVAGGEVCGVRGRSICGLLQEQSVNSETCGPTPSKTK